MNKSTIVLSHLRYNGGSNIYPRLFRLHRKPPAKSSQAEPVVSQVEPRGPSFDRGGTGGISQRVPTCTIVVWYWSFRSVRQNPKKKGFLWTKEPN